MKTDIAALAPVIERAITEGLASRLWPALLLSALISGAAAFLGAFLQKQIFTHGERFRTEFDIYRELFIELTDFLEVCNRLVSKNLDDKALDAELFQSFDRHARSLSRCLQANRPFYADSVRAKLEAVRTRLELAIKAAQSLPPEVTVQFEGQELTGPTLERARGMVVLNSAKRFFADTREMEEICNLVRSRLKFK